LRDVTLAADGLHWALPKWRAALGEAHVSVDPDLVERRSATTLPRALKATAVLRPASTGEVQVAVDIANRAGVPLYPISRGRNWGYGDATPAGPGQVLLDLSRMDRIVEVDETLAYAVIEPGVTQGQLAGHLRERGIPLWLDCTGAGPDASIVGNVLERGFGHTPYGNRFQSISGMEVVLGSGALLQTGFGHFEGARNDRVFPYGLGPSLDGLFTQSSYGIVTRLGLWLLPAAPATTQFLCIAERDDDIAALVDALRPLRLDGTIRSVIHIGNDLRVISSARTYPYERAGGVVPLPWDLRRHLRSELGAGAWTVSGALFGRPGTVRAAKALVRRALRRPGRTLVFFDQRKLNLAKRAASLLKRGGLGGAIGAKVDRAQLLLNLHCGLPVGEFLAGSYWRSRDGLPAGFPDGADPARDGCGMMWLAPVLPMTGEAIDDFRSRLEPLFERHGFDFMVTLSSVTERSLEAVLTIAFDRTIPAERDRAEGLYAAAFEAVMAAGYVPYRAGVQSMAALGSDRDPYWRLVTDLKSLLDPNGIVAPGRYDPLTARTLDPGPHGPTVSDG
jgi:4-cresol dehydrogenase (hydroxylating)